jgi:cell division septation protein DedD
MRHLRTAALAVVLSTPAGLRAQGPAGYGAARDPLLADSALAVAVQLATAGQADSGRAVVRARMATLTPADSLYPGVLYAAGIIAADTDSALTYFRRVSIEYSQSAWAAPALVRLAQFAYATGDYDGAASNARRVLTDYPATPVRGAAAYWAGRAEIELHDLAAACGHLQEAEAQAGQDVETANRARFYLQRCGTVAAAQRESAAQAPAASARGSAGFTVQLAAVQSAAAADEMMRRLTAQGYQPHVVRDTDGLLKVRVGQYRTRAEAQRLAADLKRKLGGNPIVVEEGR